jgi:hypothetical protein
MREPKNKIKKNLFTSGGEFVLKTSKEQYTGYYYKTSQGYYTGQEPTDPSIDSHKELNDIRRKTKRKNKFINFVRKTSTIVGKGIALAASAKSIIDRIINFPELLLYYPQPSEADYKNKYIFRYFIKNNVTNKFYELSPEDYTTILPQINSLRADDVYKIGTVKWYIAGYLEDYSENNIKIKGVLTLNHEELSTSETKLPGISSYLFDLSEFFLDLEEAKVTLSASTPVSDIVAPTLSSPKIEIINGEEVDINLFNKNNRNLLFRDDPFFKKLKTRYQAPLVKKDNIYTEGNELTDPRTGKDYVGFYHIEPDRGYVEGATKTALPQQVLRLKNSL